MTAVLSDRAEQVKKLVDEGDQLFAALDERRAALSALDLRDRRRVRAVSGFVNDNRKEFGPALSKINLVLANLNERRDYITEALKTAAHVRDHAGRSGRLRPRIQRQRLSARSRRRW